MDLQRSALYLKRSNPVQRISLRYAHLWTTKPTENKIYIENIFARLCKKICKYYMNYKVFFSSQTDEFFCFSEFDYFLIFQILHIEMVIIHKVTLVMACTVVGKYLHALN